MNIIDNFNKKFIKDHLFVLKVGDTAEINIWVIESEGNKKRLQIFEGIVIAIRNRGLHSSFTIRKISSGEGIERVFQTHSPIIKSIKIKKTGVFVRQAKLYYLRGLRGKSARIKTRLLS